MPRTMIAAFERTTNVILGGGNECEFPLESAVDVFKMNIHLSAMLASTVALFYFVLIVGTTFGDRGVRLHGTV